MEEDIKIIENYFNYECTKRLITSPEIQAIEHLIARNKELEEKYNALYKDNMKQWEERCRMAIELDNEVIPKSKVREKIEELEKEIEEKHENGCDFTLIYEHEIDTNAIIQVLQELLEEE